VRLSLVGAGTMVGTDELVTIARKLLSEDRMKSVHMRSGTNTGYTCRIEKA